MIAMSVASAALVLGWLTYYPPKGYQKPPLGMRVLMAAQAGGFVYGALSLLVGR